MEMLVGGERCEYASQGGQTGEKKENRVLEPCRSTKRFEVPCRRLPSLRAMKVVLRGRDGRRAGSDTGRKLGQGHARERRQD